MQKLLANICRSKLYWSLVFLFALSLELIALYYQYELGYGPCILCVEVRAIVFAIMLIALSGIVLGRVKWVTNLTNIALSASGVFLYLKAKLLVSIERNEIESACGFKANFPQWLPLDTWLPSMFEPWEACGYTPMMMFDNTMGELLVYCAMFIFSLGVLGLIVHLLFGKHLQARSLFNGSTL